MKGSLLALFTLDGHQALFSSESESYWVKAVGLALFTQRSESRTKNASSGGGGGGGGGGHLANFKGSHFMALAESATVCWNKPRAKL